ncbi:hypothetical protein LEMLEM_LOCUS17905, partial [Lemmus lemmus]
RVKSPLVHNHSSPCQAKTGSWATAAASWTFHDSETHPLLAAPITSRRRWASKRLLMKLVSHLGKKLLLPGLLEELDMQDLQRNDC